MKRLLDRAFRPWRTGTPYPERVYGGRNPTIRAEVESIRVKPGQALTVWLDGEQVDLRVLHDGTREIFCDAVQARPYDEWAPSTDNQEDRK